MTVIDVHAIDLDRCLELATALEVDAAWRDRAACTDCPTDPFFEDDAPPADMLARCDRCDVRNECLVEGLRTSLDRTLAESRNELYGWFGGLGPDERWGLREELRRRCQARGAELAEATTCRVDLVLRYHERGLPLERIAGELGVDLDVAAGALVEGLADRGLSNRNIAAFIPHRSYKWVERRRHQLGLPVNAMSAA